MGSQTPLQLPVIDFSNIHKHNPGSSVWDTTKNKVFQAFQEYGCFEASFEAPELRKSVFNLLEQLFDLPLETKLRNAPKRTFGGYLGQSKHLPLFESLGIEVAEVESFTNDMWPQGNAEFCKNIEIYSKKLMELDEIVRRMVLEKLRLEEYFNEHMELTSYLLRVMKYSVPEENESNVGLIEHTDTNLTTILHQNEVEGLEVKTKNGEWIKVKYSSQNSFIVTAGVTFHAWTNGRLHAPFHKVVMTENKARFSLGMFSIPKPGKLIKAPEEMVDEEHPLLFKPFDYGEFRKFTFQGDNISDKFPLKTFCGVSS